MVENYRCGQRGAQNRSVVPVWVQEIIVRTYWMIRGLRGFDRER
jgi:hypothetical protein